MGPLRRVAGSASGRVPRSGESLRAIGQRALPRGSAVVDTGLHAMGWTREQAIDYFKTHAPDESLAEVDRYIGWPGQALSYYLGEMAIWKARHKAEAALGPKFNVRAFHDAVLELGSVPLPVLEQHIDAFIAKGGVGPYPEMEQ